MDMHVAWGRCEVAEGCELRLPNVDDLRLS